jgi:hypothetical protein
LKDWVITTLPDGFTRVAPVGEGQQTVSRTCLIVLLLSVCFLGLSLFSGGSWRLSLMITGIAGIIVTIPLWGSNIRWEWRVGPDLLEVRQRSLLTGASAECYREALFEIHGFTVANDRRATMLFLCPARGGKALTHLANGSPAEVRALANLLAEITGWAIQERMRD